MGTTATIQATGESAKGTSYEVRYNGEVINTRNSHRAYRAAVVIVKRDGSAGVFAYAGSHQLAEARLNEARKGWAAEAEAFLIATWTEAAAKPAPAKKATGKAPARAAEKREMAESATKAREAAPKATPAAKRPEMTDAARAAKTADVASRPTGHAAERGVGRGNAANRAKPRTSATKNPGQAIAAALEGHKGETLTTPQIVELVLASGADLRYGQISGSLTGTLLKKGVVEQTGTRALFRVAAN